MICPDCGHDNIPGDDSCSACGQPLAILEDQGSQLEQTIARHTVDVLCPKKPISVEASATAREAVGCMVKNGIGCLLVLNEGTLVGIVTERDVLNKMSAERTLDRPVSKFMTAAPSSIESNESIAYALHTMDVGGYRHLPIVDQNGKPIGIISVRDILRFLCTRFAELRGEIQ